MIAIDSELVKEMAEHKRRVDGRNFDSYREISVRPCIIKKAAGSAEVTIGNTKIVAGVKIEIGEPFEDTPEEGVIMVNTEFVPFALEEFESGPPSDESVEVSRVVDRVLRESECIDLKKLCIVPGKKVWIIFIDIDVLDHDGNLHDAIELATISALLTAKMPKIDEEGNPNYEEYTDEKLPIRNKPVSITCVKIGDSILVDPKLVEMEAMDARLTVGVFKEDEEYKFCAIQKGGSGGFTTEEIERILELALKKADELLEKLPG